MGQALDRVFRFTTTRGGLYATALSPRILGCNLSNEICVRIFSVYHFCSTSFRQIRLSRVFRHTAAISMEIDMYRANPECLSIAQRAAGMNIANILQPWTTCVDATGTVLFLNWQNSFSMVKNIRENPKNRVNL